MPTRRRFASPLPTATAVVVAVLVAMAATLADAGALGVASTENQPAGRPAAALPSSLILSSRALANALATVAEQLEEDWSASRRPSAKGSHATTGLRLGLGLGRGGTPTIRDAVDADPTRAGGTAESPCPEHAAAEIPSRDSRWNLHRRLCNLPPPSDASRAL